MKKKKLIKCSIIFVILLVIFLLLFFIYRNLFAPSNDTRYKDAEKYKLTNNEINAVKDKIKQVENVDKVNVYTDSKIIKIVVKLKDDVDFENIKDVANESILSFDENNLKYYDLEFFVESSNEESEVYPQIGYKFKTNSEFAW